MAQSCTDDQLIAEMFGSVGDKERFSKSGGSVIAFSDVGLNKQHDFTDIDDEPLN